MHPRPSLGKPERRVKVPWQVVWRAFAASSTLIDGPFVACGGFQLAETFQTARVYRVPSSGQVALRPSNSSHRSSGSRRNW